MNKEMINKRMFNLTILIIKLLRQLPKQTEYEVIRNQLIRSSTSVGANYRAASRARSKAEFISKLGIVQEEADESLYWIDLIKELYNQIDFKFVRNEMNEILSIIVSSINTAKKLNQ